MAGQDRRRQRLEQERSLLMTAFATAALDVDSGLLILTRNPLPAGWSHAETDILVEVPTQYPFTPPDNVCARPDLKLSDGREPQNNQGQRSIAGRLWLQFSYHVDRSDWRPNADIARSSTLVDYLHGALARFEEAT